MFFTEREGKIYLASVVDCRRKKVNLSNICLGPQTFLRLMAEAVMLLKNLRAVGVTVNEPLENFVQLE